MNIKAYAKINLGLDITGRAENGYHLLRMVMQTVGLQDDIEIEKTDEIGRIELEVSDMRGLGLKSAAAKAAVESRQQGFIPSDKSNLMYKAAELMIKSCGIDGGVKMRLIKRIPSEAGLGGGSSDAAAVLKGINELYGTGLDNEELKKLGISLGADVPYCIDGGCMLAEGIGERLTAIERKLDMHVLLIKPSEGMSTPKVYAEYDKTEDRGGIVSHPDTEGIIKALSTGDADGLCRSIGNVLEYPVLESLPVVGDIKAKLMEYGAAAACMTGSGSVVYGLFKDKLKMHEAAAAFADSEYFAEISDVIETEFG